MKFHSTRFAKSMRRHLAAMTASILRRCFVRVNYYSPTRKRKRPEDLKYAPMRAYNKANRRFLRQMTALRRLGGGSYVGGGLRREWVK